MRRRSSMGIERRASTGEIRAAEDGKERTLTGYAAIFDSLSEPISGPLARGGGFREKIDRNAFANCLRSEPSIVCLLNHDPSLILGRTPKTLSLRTDNVGLHYRVQVPDTQQGNSIWESVRRKDIVSSSFGFTAEDDSWSDDNVRTLRQVVLHDVSPVTWPAYRATTCSVRSAGGALIEIPLGWYRMVGKLRQPPLNEAEIRSKMRKLRQEMGDGDADDSERECTCGCEPCSRDNNCPDCDCGGCASVDCQSGDSEDCRCAGRREAQGRMKPSCHTIYPSDAGPLYRETLQKEMGLTRRLFDARQAMKKWR